MRELIDKLEMQQTLTQDEFVTIIEKIAQSDREYLFEKSRAKAQQYYGNGIYTRGLIEISNYCKNDCYYCGIRKSNDKASRYRLTEEEILSCCEIGYQLGFRTFVMQGGEDGYFTDDRMVQIISHIRKDYPDCAITLSIGEKLKETYQRFYDAGANRFLLRHETADEDHYGVLHPESMSSQHRKQCLYWLKEIGFQVGSGFMVGSPGQTAEHLAKDLLFLKQLQPQMVGIGPFIRHHDTPFAKYESGTLEQTLLMIGILRLMFPNILIPATTALGTIHPYGREQGVLAGANVVMPNLSPLDVRKKYMLYDNKISSGVEAAECRSDLEERMQKIGYHLLVDRGDCKKE